MLKEKGGKVETWKDMVRDEEDVAWKRGAVEGCRRKCGALGRRGVHGCCRTGEEWANGSALSSVV